MSDLAMAMWCQEHSNEAADRIAELEAENARQQQTMIEWQKLVDGHRNELEARIAKLEAALREIVEYPREGHHRRDEDGYPSEIVYDEFAYKRIVDAYRDHAREVLKTEAGDE